MLMNHVMQRGPSGVALILGVSTVMAYGFYKISETNQRKRCAAIRIHMITIIDLPFKCMSS